MINKDNLDEIYNQHQLWIKTKGVSRGQLQDSKTICMLINEINRLQDVVSELKGVLTETDDYDGDDFDEDRLPCTCGTSVICHHEIDRLGDKWD